MSALQDGSASVSRHDTYRTTKYFESFDGLRALFILAVVWHHSPAYSSVDSPALILMRGFVGVDFFFVLSGFLITTILVREESASGNISLSNFYWRRLLRIGPPFFLTVGALSFYYIVIQGEWDYLRLVPYYLLFLSNFLDEHIPMLTITWSLSVEEQFYVIWPSLMILTLAAFRSRVLLLTVLIAANVIAMAVSTAMDLSGPQLGPLTIGLPPATYAPLLMGALCALLLHRRESFDAIDQVLGYKIVPPVLLVALIALLIWLPVDLRGWPNFVLHTTMSCLIMALTLSRGSALHRVLLLRPLVRIGVVSYGIYLYHHIARHFTNEAMEVIGVDNPWILLVLMIAGAIAMAEISYRFMEKPILNMRHKKPSFQLGRYAKSR